MGKKLYVGNLQYSITEQNLSEAFSKFGSVDSVKIIMDRETNRSKGFGFVEMSTEEEAQEAIAKLNGTDLGNRPLTVNEARPMAARDDRGGSRGGSRGAPMGGRSARW